VKRREFITLLGGAAAAWPLVAGAQQPNRMRRIGMLMSASEIDTEYQSLLATFRDELKRLGWEHGRNIRIDYRWKAVDEESRQRSARELVALQPDLMLGQSTPTTAALLQQTSTIPIVFLSVGDPVARRRGDRAKRRELIALLGGATAWPLVARARLPVGDL